MPYLAEYVTYDFQFLTDILTSEVPACLNGPRQLCMSSDTTFNARKASCDVIGGETARLVT